MLFPLLEEVKCLSSTAPDESLERAESNTPILVHHSRNTACKQWAETQVGTISGVARVFQVCWLGGSSSFGQSFLEVNYLKFYTELYSALETPNASLGTGNSINR